MMRALTLLALLVTLAAFTRPAAAQQNVLVNCQTGTTSMGAVIPSPASAANPCPVQTAATSAGGLVPVSSAALAANLVIKASAGNLYGLQVSADSTLSGAAWWVMVYNAASAPADGAVTPAKCFAMASGVTHFEVGWGPIGASFPTGITAGVSTTGCFTKTESIHAFISGDAK